MRKKLWILGLALLMLLTAACQKQPSVETPTEAPNITDPTVATDPSLPTQPTEPTVPPTEPTTPPSEPTEATTPPMLSSRYYPFCFRENEPMPDKGIDISGLQEGWLYSYDRETGKIYLIADLAKEWVTGEWTTAYGYIHLISADRKEVIRCSYTGENKTVVYETANEITYIDYSKPEILLVVEDEKRAIFADISTGTRSVVMEYYYIESAHYVSALETQSRERIMWYGKDTEDAEVDPDSLFNSYLYYLDTKELVKTRWL